MALKHFPLKQPLTNTLVISVLKFFTMVNGIKNNLFSLAIVEQEFVGLSRYVLTAVFCMLVYHNDPTVLLVKNRLHLLFSKHGFVFCDNKFGFQFVVAVISAQKNDDCYYKVALKPNLAADV